MKRRLNTIILSTVLISLAACKKDKDPVKPVVPAVLSITMNQPYLMIGQVDSAFAIWKTGNVEERVRLTISNDSLLANMSGFEEGSGQLLVQIFSNKKYRNQYYSQWVLRKTVTLKKTAALHYTGPVSFYDADWFPRVELADAIGHRAVIALRPDDPYFLVKDPGHALYSLQVDRSYWKTIGGIQLAGQDTWFCHTACTDIVNEDYFTSLPGRIGNKPWNHISITILFEVNDNGEGWILSLEYEP